MLDVVANLLKTWFFQESQTLLRKIELLPGGEIAYLRLFYRINGTISEWALFLT